MKIRLELYNWRILGKLVSIGNDGPYQDDNHAIPGETNNTAQGHVGEVTEQNQIDCLIDLVVATHRMETRLCSSSISRSATDSGGEDVVNW